ncbi:threonyl-tRNA synthetase [Shewanella scandinavica]|uniref:Threonyl-tRNA synthetase n=1 Tax=Shewanella scandinavica TaxID=3063538 RepID=A0ABU3G543_9GAMM|nr:threonyl-tRNA synthetase [Shewanella sp. SP2S1-2]MDT3281637.1 threonyl-tRNA synthetase [Shewanella sp. SP2S1-2]
MDKALFIPSAIISAILFIIYAFICFKNKSELDQKIITNLILQAFQIVCGGVLIASTFISELKDLVTDLNLYILIAGAVLLINSVQSAITDLRKPINKSNKSIPPTTDAAAD